MQQGIPLNEIASNLGVSYQAVKMWVDRKYNADTFGSPVSCTEEVAATIYTDRQRPDLAKQIFDTRTIQNSMPYIDDEDDDDDAPPKPQINGAVNSIPKPPQAPTQQTQQAQAPQQHGLDNKLSLETIAKYKNAAIGVVILMMMVEVWLQATVITDMHIKGVWFPVALIPCIGHAVCALFFVLFADVVDESQYLFGAIHPKIVYNIYMALMVFIVIMPYGAEVGRVIMMIFYPLMLPYTITSLTNIYKKLP